MFDIRARLIPCAAGLALLLGPATAAHAVTYFFNNISNVSGIAGQVAPQLSVDVTAQAGAVRFTFNNNGPIAPSITDIYFDDPDPKLFVIGSTTVDNISGVSFSPNASPPNLPNPNNVVPAFNAAFSADSNSQGGGTLTNGVNNVGGDSVAIVLALTAGSTFAGVLSELGAGTLRIGLHVQGIPGINGTSDSYIATTPVPAALPLFVTGVVAMGLLRRRRKNSNLVTA